MNAPINGTDMHFEDAGSGVPLLLLHGLGLNCTIWNPLVSLFAGQARFITPDLRGHGQTALGSGDGTLEQFADDLAALCDFLKLYRVVLAGHSMGGYIALAFLERHPQRLSGLAMVATNARADSDEKRRERLDEATQVLAQGSQVTAKSLGPKLSPDAQANVRYAAMIAECPPEGLANVQRAIALRPARLGLLSELAVPLLVIRGEKDAIAPAEAAAEMAEAAPQGCLVSLPEVGHMPMLEAPLTLGALLLTLKWKR